PPGGPPLPHLPLSARHDDRRGHRRRVELPRALGALSPARARGVRGTVLDPLPRPSVRDAGPAPPEGRRPPGLAAACRAAGRIARLRPCCRASTTSRSTRPP